MVAQTKKEVVISPSSSTCLKLLLVLVVGRWGTRTCNKTKDVGGYSWFWEVFMKFYDYTSRHLYRRIRLAFVSVLNDCVAAVFCHSHE